jgi:transcriptional regulator with GAF, ATPase, and Fis domain
MVEAGTFREDLYYRLNVFPLTVPPLRERVEDIPLLVRHLVHTYAQRLRKRIDIIPADVLEALTRYHWPGNVRELQNVIERAVILTPDIVLRLPPAEWQRSRSVTDAPQQPDAGGGRTRAHPAGAAGLQLGDRGAAGCRGAPGVTTHDVTVSHGEARHSAPARVTAG